MYQGPATEKGKTIFALQNIDGLVQDCSNSIANAVTAVLHKAIDTTVA